MNEWKSPLDNLPDPFSTEYLKGEIEFYGAEEYDDGNGVKVEHMVLQRINRLDDYLNKRLRSNEEIDFHLPRLMIDNSIWMSLTWMEVQAMFCPINFAVGIVGTAGLGMGYYPLRVAERSDVWYVDVYEWDERVIQYFTNRFQNHPAFDSINIIHGDARELVKGKEYDFFYIDTYRTMMDDEIIPDIELYTKNNEIEFLYFWSLEKILLAMLILQSPLEDDWEPYEGPVCDLQPLEKWYFRKWFETDGVNLWDGWFMYANRDYIQKVVQALVDNRIERGA